MTARDIADLFADLELRLIQSLKRNLRRHKDQEKAEGGKEGVPESWPAWQAEKLRSLNKFRRQNQKIVDEFSSRIDTETRTMMEEQFAEADGTEQAFFGVNADKVGALIDEMTATEADVQKAALRYMDDVYRRTILRADAALTAGGVTMQQAVDLAVKDFLVQGITCIRYKNGRRVNIATYAEMALRTSNTRAMLLGEAQKRERMGIDTVLVSQYGACSETCLPWQGLVYIDDVWQPYSGEHTPGGSYGVSRNGHSYMLLSVAVKAGLFHPNCRHTVGTWIEGVSRRPKPMDKAKIEAASKLEARQRRMELKVREDKRLAEGTQDPDQVKAYKAALRRDQKALRDFVNEHGDVLRRDRWRERNDLPGTSVPVDRGRYAGKATDEVRPHGELPKQIGTLPEMSDGNAKAFLQEVEQRTHNLSHEEDYTILRDGTVWRTKGTAASVHPEAIQSKYGHTLQGSYSYHNHPARSTHYSMSGEDAGFFLEYGVQYSQASDERYIYFMERTPETLPANYEEVTGRFRKIMEGPVREMAFYGQIDPDLEEYHEAMKLLSQEYRFRYERVMRDDR